MELGIKSEEQGRSMVEMLGVLAIIGVISIGGIAGYIYGMNKYRTNELLDGGNKRAYTISTQISLGKEPEEVSLDEFKEFDVTAGGTFDTVATAWVGQFGLKVSGISKPVCENLIRVAGEKATLQAIAKVEEGAPDMTLSDCTEDNTVYFVYNNDMSIQNDPSTSRNSSAGSGSASSSTEMTLPTCTIAHCTPNTPIFGPCMACITKTSQWQAGCGIMKSHGICQ
ncbi:MAG: hypothetical protein IKS41_00260 [Alphaproteobacteria bacterium]|nr:hypothetical protein [Alphaproteobacteria bacterium]